MGTTPRWLRCTQGRIRVAATVLLACVATTARAAGPDAPAPAPPSSTSPASPARPAGTYSLEVESDEPDELSYDALATALKSELGADVPPPSPGAPAGVAIVVRYRASDHLLTVRATHPGGRVVERSVTTTGDAPAMRHEAVLLAGNVARDEARELLDALAAKQPTKEPGLLPVEPAPAPAEPAPAPATAPPDGTAGAAFALVYPLATNARHPDVRTAFALSLFYGRVGTVTALQLGLGGVVHATRAVRGAQVALVATASEGPIRGAQVGGITNIGLGTIRGAQASTALNLAFEDLHGAQLTAGGNVTSGRVRGAQIAAGVNVAGSVDGAQGALINVSGDVEGAQVGLVNIAREVRGAQVGLLNIATKVDGVALGLFSITPDGVHPLAWTSNLAYVNVGLKFATKYVYTVTALGSGTNETKKNNGNLHSLVAVGGHAKLPGRFDAEVETAYSSAPTDSVDADPSATAGTNHSLHQRGIVGYSFAPRVRLFAGFGLRIPLAFDAGSLAVRPEFMGGIQF